MKQSVIGIICAIGSVLVAHSVTQDWPPNKPGVHWILSLLVGLLVLVYFLYAASAYNNQRPRALLANEKFITEEHYHPVYMVATATMLGVLAVAFLLFGFILLLSHPYLHKQFEAVDFQTNQTVSRNLKVPIWELPILPGLTALVVMFYVIEVWRQSTVVLTNKRIIRRRKASPYLFISEIYDPVQLDQVLDVDDGASAFGKSIGYGWITLVLRLFVAADDSRKESLQPIRSSEAFADKIRELSPFINPDNAKVRAKSRRR